MAQELMMLGQQPEGAGRKAIVLAPSTAARGVKSRPSGPSNLHRTFPSFLAQWCIARKLPSLTTGTIRGNKVV